MEDRITDGQHGENETSKNAINTIANTPGPSSAPRSPYYFDKGLRKVHAYNHTYLTYAKQRWLGRELLEIFTTEFRDRSGEFYAWAINNGTVMINGKVVDGTYIVRNGDLISNVAHRHEPPIIAGRVGVYYRDEEEGVLVVEKKASMPIHATGRYKNNTLLEVLKNEEGLEVVSTSNRLDRLVSGIMIIATTRASAQRFGKDFGTPGRVSKEYVARVLGKFPANRETISTSSEDSDSDIGEGEDLVCEEPILTIDKQIGVNVVHPEGRPCKTIFKRLSYDPETDTSVVSCRPVTGRSHQLRVHLQFLGHSIANDPIYNNEVAWGQDRAKGGIFKDLESSRSPEALASVSSPSRPEKNCKDAVDEDVGASAIEEEEEEEDPKHTAGPAHSSTLSLVDADVAATMDSSLFIERKKAPNTSRYARREQKRAQYSSSGPLKSEKAQRTQDYEDRKGASFSVDDVLAGNGSQTLLIPEAVNAILHLRKVRDEEDNFARYRDMDRPPLPSHELPRHGGQEGTSSSDSVGGRSMSAKKGLKMMSRRERDAISLQQKEESQDNLSTKQKDDPEWYVATDEKGQYCKVCGLPLLPDPEVNMLEIWLHAIRYRTDEWDYASPLPEWARQDWKATDSYRRSSYAAETAGRSVQEAI